MFLKKSLWISGILLCGLIHFADANSNQPASFSSSLFQPWLASDGVDKIKEALTNDEDGIFDVGLDAVRTFVVFFLIFYGLYLGLSVAFGQSEPGAITAFFVGSMMALGAQAVAGLFLELFPKK
ncbi:MAG: hypothetical protein ACOY3I_08450 [Verrucomicrobiota bacterium]